MADMKEPGFFLELRQSEIERRRELLDRARQDCATIIDLVEEARKLGLDAGLEMLGPSSYSDSRVLGTLRFPDLDPDADGPYMQDYRLSVDPRKQLLWIDPTGPHVTAGDRRHYRTGDLPGQSWRSAHPIAELHDSMRRALMRAMSSVEDERPRLVIGKVRDPRSLERNVSAPRSGWLSRLIGSFYGKWPAH